MKTEVLFPGWSAFTEWRPWDTNCHNKAVKLTTVDPKHEYLVQEQGPVNRMYRLIRKEKKRPE